MTNLNILETFRTKEELLNYFEAIGQSITEEEIENLKRSYEQAQENNNALSLQQLDDVAGGVLTVYIHTGDCESVYKSKSDSLTHKGDGTCHLHPDAKAISGSFNNGYEWKISFYAIDDGNHKDSRIIVKSKQGPSDEVIDPNTNPENYIREWESLSRPVSEVTFKAEKTKVSPNRHSYDENARSAAYSLSVLDINCIHNKNAHPTTPAETELVKTFTDVYGFHPPGKPNGIEHILVK